MFELLILSLVLATATSVSGKYTRCESSSDCDLEERCHGYVNGLCVALNEQDNNYCNGRSDPGSLYTCKDGYRCAFLSEKVDGGYVHSRRCIPIVDVLQKECWHGAQCSQSDGRHALWTAIKELKIQSVFVAGAPMKIQGTLINVIQCRNIAEIPPPEECPNTKGCVYPKKSGKLTRCITSADCKLPEVCEGYSVKGV